MGLNALCMSQIIKTHRINTLNTCELFEGHDAQRKTNACHVSDTKTSEGGAEHYKATCRLLRLGCSRLSMWLRETTQDCLKRCQIGRIKVKCTQHLESDHGTTVAYDGIHCFMRYQETHASCQFWDGAEAVPVDFRCLAVAK